MNDKVKVLPGETVLVDDGEAKLSFTKGIGKDIFGLTVSDDGGFSCVFCNRGDWHKIKETIEAYLEEK